MGTRLFSESWHRVADLRPKLRPHAEIHRHHYRGERWYVLQDHATGAFHRFEPGAHFLIGLMDGERTVQQIWEAGLARLGDDAPTQDELIQLLSQLHAADVLLSGVTPDDLELLQRFDRKQSAKRMQRWASPMSIKVPLVDPDRYLDRMEPWARYFFTWPAALVWLAAVATAIVLAASHWPELTQNVTDRVLTPRNIVMLSLLYPAIKLVHEMGHALATKVWGGEVHEMGIMFLVLMPIPYVDASASSAFRSRSRRVVVGSAGIMVELFLAALAMFVWLNVEPGMMRSAAYNVMLIGGVSTVLVNGNPLLRFDGYYILLDLLEIPNLAQRSKRHLRYVAERYLYGVEDAESPASAPGEAFWLTVYGIAGFIYRIFLFTIIILFIAGKFFIVGVLLALWAAFGMLVMPVYRTVKYLLTDPRLGRSRNRAVATAGTLTVAALLFFLLVPMPSATVAEGVIWIPSDSIVRADTEGFVERVLVEPGAEVSAGDPLVVCVNPELSARVEILQHRVDEVQARIAALQVDDPVEAEMARDELESVRAELDRARRDEDELTLRARRDGTVVLSRAQDLPGRFVAKGELLGYVLDLSAVTARVVVPQGDVHLVRQRTRAVSARLAENLSETEARLLREVPAASSRLPSSVLGTEGGGQIAIDPRAGRGDTAMQTLFQFDIALPALSRINVGGRVHVRFDHGYEPLARQFYRSVRQLLLRRFRV